MNLQENYENLANAIIVQASKDYRDALARLKKFGNDTEAQKTKRECEAFFRSSWYATLTQVDGEFLISALKAEVAI